MDYNISDSTNGDDSLDIDNSDISGNDAVEYGEFENMDVGSFDSEAEIEPLELSDGDSLFPEFDESQSETDVSPDSDGDYETSDAEATENNRAEFDDALHDPVAADVTSGSEEIETSEVEESNDLPTDEVTATEETETQPEGSLAEIDAATEDGAEAMPDIDPEVSEAFSESDEQENKEIDNLSGEKVEDPPINTELLGSYPNPVEYEEESGDEEIDIGEVEETEDSPIGMTIDDAASDIPELKFETAEEGALQDGDVNNGKDPCEDEIPMEEIGSIRDFPESLENDTDQSFDLEGKTFKPDQTSLWEAGLHAIDNNVEALRDNLRDQGMKDGPEMEAIVMAFRKDSMEELRRNIEGESSEKESLDSKPVVKDNFDDSTEQIDDEMEILDYSSDIARENDVIEEQAEAFDSIDDSEEIIELDDDGFDQSLTEEDIQGIDQKTTREYDDFERSVMDEKPDFYDSGAFYEQGINEYGYEGTCGPTSQANAINRLLETNEFTEQKILKVAVDNGLCNTDKSPESCGGTTTKQFMDLYDTVNKQIGDRIQTDLYEYENALSVEEAAAKLDEGCVLNVAVDAMALWDQPREYVNSMGIPCDDFYSDHWITVTGVQRDEVGCVLGFNIIDSGGGIDYVDVDKYQEMCFGSDEHKLLDPTTIVVSKKENLIAQA